MPVEIVHPPIRPAQFVRQTCLDEEFLRPRAGGVTYVRGKHGGFDFQDAARAPIYAVCDGTVKHVDFGAALGTSQFVIRCRDGSGAFYAHTFTRPKDGVRVKAGDVVAEMGNSSSFPIGVHLHFETLADWSNWRTSVYNAGKELRQLREVYTMFTADEVKFLKNLVKIAREDNVTANDVAHARMRLSEHVADHKKGKVGLADHSHKGGKVTLSVGGADGG
ncbi:MAG TPA: M23 family metallopeptidase [Actinomycetota bacterium]